MMSFLRNLRLGIVATLIFYGFLAMIPFILMLLWNGFMPDLWSGFGELDYFRSAVICFVLAIACA